MRRFTAAGEAVTPVPTAFLAKDMLEAPSDYVKVYLYGLYLAGAGTEASDVSMENKLHMKGSDIDEALRYWAERGLIHVQQTDGCQCYSFGKGPERIERREPFPYAAFNMQVKDIFKRDLKPSELKRLYSYLDDDKLPQDLVLRLLDYCVGIKGRNVGIQYIDKVEQNWVERGFHTLKDAEDAIQEFQARTSGARQILRRMGIFDRNPGSTELEFYRKWTKDWGFTHEGIEAAMQGKEFTKSSPFKYLDAILNQYHSQGALRAQEISEVAARTDERNGRIKELLKTLNSNSLTITQSCVDYYGRWQQEGFAHSVIMLAGQDAAKTGPRTFERVDRILDSWKKHGLVSEAQVREHLKRQSKVEMLVREVYDLAGIKAPIQDTDKAFYRKYARECGMDHDTICYAAELSSIAEAPGRYMRALLKQWAKANVHTLQQAMTVEEQREKPRVNIASAAPAYPQRQEAAAYADKRGVQAFKELQERYGAH